MADQKRIKLYQGHATPKNIILRELPVATASTGTRIYLYTTHATPKNVILRDPTTLVSVGEPGTITGTFNVTIDAVTLAASADLLVQATFAQTIDAVTLSADADLIIAGTFAQTIDPVTLAASADVLVQATAGQTLDPVTLAATGALIIQGTFGQTLDAVTLDASGELIAVAGNTDRGGDDGGYVRQRRKFKHVTARKLQELLEAKPDEEAPQPTHRRVRKVKREIVAAIEASGLLGPAKPAVARFVEQALVQAYVPEMDWAALAEAVAGIMRRAAEEAARIEQEIEDEDEFLILMAA